MRRRTDPGLLLLLTPVLWGATFPGAKIALRELPVLPFMAWTRTLGFLAILATVPLLRRAGDGPRRRAREAVWPGLVLGALIFAGYTLQTEGLVRTTATNAGIITGLYVVFTPLFAGLAFRRRVSPAAWRAVAVSLVGLAFLSIQDLSDVRVHAGDALVLLGAVAWAGHITAVAHYSPRFPPWLLSLAQMGATAAFHLVASAETGLRVTDALSAEVWPLLVLTGVLGSGVGFTLQVMAQQTLAPTRAVVILAGEAIFAALFGALWLGERLAAHQWVGGLLVVAAMVYSELRARRPAGAHLEPASAP